MKKICAAYWAALILLLLLGFWVMAEGRARFEARTHAQMQSGEPSLSRMEDSQRMFG